MSGSEISRFGSVGYSIFNVLAYVAAGSTFFCEIKRKKNDSEQMLYLVFAALLGALIGSRLGSALFVYRELYLNQPLAFFQPAAGGKTLVGGLIGGYIGVVAGKKILKIKRPTGDLFAPGIALGIAVGRIGCFLNGCCYGVPTNLPWGAVFKGAVRHPTQIYESIFCLALFIYLWLIRKRIRREGDLFKIFIFSYALFRFWIEFLRADRVNIIFGLSLAQLISVGVLISLTVSYLKREERCSAPS